MPNPADIIRRELETWPGVAAAPHRFGGFEYRVGNRELGHVHGNHHVDLPFPVRIREELVSSGRAVRHHILPDTGWVTFFIHGDDDVARAIELFRLNYERPWLATPRDPGEPAGGARDGSPGVASRADDLVDEASEDSFPASDPPGFGPITGVGHESTG